jgi:hypothetical protein
MRRFRNRMAQSNWLGYFLALVTILEQYWAASSSHRWQLKLRTSVRCNGYRRHWSAVTFAQSGSPGMHRSRNACQIYP